MLLPAATQAQREETGTSHIAGVNHRGATPTETHGSKVYRSPQLSHRP